MGEVKNVFVTGGSSGIGRAIVEKFASYSNYFVYFTYNSNFTSANDIERKFSNTKSYQCDITENIKVQELLQLLKDTNVTIDILVNNAGIMKDSTFLKMSQNVWDDVIDFNLKSLFPITQPLLTGMVERGWGRVINLSSVAGIEGAFGKTNYSASKAGVIGFSKSLALETARKGVTVNVVAPGMIDTNMIKSIPDQYMQKILESIPMNRFGKPEEVAALVYFLASDNAAYITGQAISVNGGMH